MNTIFLDQAAGGFPKSPAVAEAMAQAILNGCGNINRSTYSLSTDTGLKIMEAREEIASFFGCRDCERLVFTPGATYSINAVMRGLVGKGQHLIISAMEHNAVWRTASDLERQGAELSVAPCDKDGFLDIAAFEKLFRSDTRLVILAHASNVNGVLQDISPVKELCEKHGVFLALDAAQTAGHIPLHIEKLGVDAICFPGHKGLGGPQGIGGIVLSSRILSELKASVTGGTGSRSSSENMPENYPDHLEPGTMNLPGILGLAAAVRELKSEGLAQAREKEILLTEKMLKGLASLPGVYVPGPSAQQRVGVVSVDFETMDNGEVAAILEENYGILTRCGLHCAPLAHKSLGTYPQGTVRFSLGRKNCEADVDAAISAVREIVMNK